MAENQKKENFFKRAINKIASYAKATKSELKKVTWPSKKQLLNNTTIVIVCIAVVALFIFVLDTVFGFGFSFFNDNKAYSDIELPTDATEYVVEMDNTEIAE